MAKTNTPVQWNPNDHGEKITESQLLLREFCQTSAIPCLIKIHDYHHPFVKFFWALVLLGGTAACAWHCSLLVTKYLNASVQTGVSVVNQRVIEFPSVTICNMNPLKASKLGGTRFEKLVKFDQALEASESASSAKSSNSSSTTATTTTTTISTNSTTTSIPASMNSASMNSAATPAATTVATPAATTVAHATASNSTNTTTTQPPAGKRKRDVEDDSNGDVDNREKRDLASDMFGDLSSGLDASYDPSFFDSSIWDAPSIDNNLLSNDFGLGSGVKMPNMPGSPSDLSTSTSGGLLQQLSQLGSILGNSILIKPDYSYMKSSARDENDVVGLMKGSQTDDFSDVLAVIRPTQKEIQDYGHLDTDLIRQCTFDAVDCSSWKWYPIENQKYGRCYTFNHGVGTKIIQTNKFGSEYGLKLTLDPEVNEYVGLFAPTVGIRVVIHPSSIRPYPDQTGINAPTGFSTQIGIRKNSISRLVGVSDCNNDTSSQDKNDTVTKTYSYSMLSCLDDCVQDSMNNTCQCWDRFDGGDDNVKKCSYFNETQNKCREDTHNKYDQGKLDCSCTQSCADEYFSTTVSTAEWPSSRYNRILMKKLNEPIANSSKQLVYVQVYFEELNYQHIEETLAYSLENLFADLGGILGLYIGLSVCGMVELLEMIFIGIRLCFVGMNGNRVVAVPHP